MGFYPFPGGRQPLSRSPLRWLTICLSPHFAFLSRFSVYFMCLPLWLLIYFEIWHITIFVPYNRHDRKYLLQAMTVIYSHLLLNGLRYGKCRNILLLNCLSAQIYIKISNISISTNIQEQIKISLQNCLNKSAKRIEAP